MNEPKLKLHLGCGKRFIPGFYHIDALTYPHVDHVGPVDELSFLADGSASLIYACHLLEHFDRKRADLVLAEWYRVLAPNGILRLAVPDFEACAKLYLSGTLANGLDDIMGPLVGGQRDQYDYHNVAFDEATLARRLVSVGFHSPRRWDWRATEHSHIDDYSQAYLPHLDKENGTLISLNMEASR